MSIPNDAVEEVRNLSPRKICGDRIFYSRNNFGDPKECPTKLKIADFDIGMRGKSFMMAMHSHFHAKIISQIFKVIISHSTIFSISALSKKAKTTLHPE